MSTWGLEDWLKFISGYAWVLGAATALVKAARWGLRLLREKFVANARAQATSLLIECETAQQASPGVLEFNPANASERLVFESLEAAQRFKRGSFGGYVLAWR